MSEDRKTALSVIAEHVLDEAKVTASQLLYHVQVSLADEHGYKYQVWRSDWRLGHPEQHELINAEQEVLRILADLIGDRMREKIG